MGWFWADRVPAIEPVAPHPLPKSDATPPPGCPMHSSTSSTPSFAPRQSHPGEPSSCPVKSPSSPFAAQKPPSATQQARTPEPSSTFSKLNPLNYMPSSISQSRAPNQTVNLPLDREISSIPRGDADSNWEYPSPQQMYNAMLRKGYTDTPADAVESMVAVHNFLNEGAWYEIVEWERIFGKGLLNGWELCKTSEEERIRRMQQNQGTAEQPRLLRFQGRPKDMTPKATILQVMGWIYPQRFGTEPPFDRHDWYVSRKTPDGGEREVRYVIDYYSGPPEPTGEPVFYLDIRPAIDGPTAAVERMMRWGGDVWWKASGGAAREKKP